MRPDPTRWIVLGLVVLAALTFLAMFSPAPAQEAETPSPVAKVLFDRPTAICTAFYVGHNLFVSAGHCVDEEYPTSMSVQLTDGSIHPVRVVAFSLEDGLMPDYSILYARGRIAVEPLELNCDTPPVAGDAVTARGYGKIIGYAETHGELISDISLMDRQGWVIPMIKMDLPIMFGMSGGPVTSDGKVIGITVSILEDVSTISFATPISYVCGLIPHGS